MTRITIIALTTILLAVACKADKTQSASSDSEASTPAAAPTTGITLEQAWATDTTLQTSESVLWDPDNGVYLVSCIGNVPPSAEDGDGYIAIIDQRGKVVKDKWAIGLDAPKGMGMYDGKLFVTDINELVIIDRSTGATLERLPVEGAQFLNDVAIGPTGEVLFSDSNTNTIHQYSDGSVSTYVQDTALGGPNGLYIDDETITVSGFGDGSVTTIDRASKQLSKHGTVTGGDGVEPWSGGMIISNWNGEVYFADANWNLQKALDTKSDKMNAADVEVNQEKGLLLVPTFFDNRVVAYNIK